MKLLHIADLHIGKIVNGFSLLEDQRFTLAGVLEIARREETDALLLAGDLYDKSAPSAEAVALLDWFLTRASEMELPCFAIPGNHDSSERVAYAAGPLARQGIYVAPLFDGTVAHYSLEDEHGPVVFWLLPFLKPAQVRPHFPDAEIGTDYTAAIEAVLGACPLDAGTRNVLLCHQFVTAGGIEPERCDSELSIGGLDNVDASVFDRFDYVALGHIHRAQRIGRDEVRYAGSILKYSASEVAHVKSATLVTLGAKGADGGCPIEIEAIPIPPLHDMRRIKGPLEELVSPAVVEAADAEDYLHVTLTDERPLIDALARLRAVYPNVMSLEYACDERARAEADSPAPADEPDLNPFMLFERFFEEQTGAALTDEQKAIAEGALRRQKEAAATGESGAEEGGAR